MQILTDLQRNLLKLFTTLPDKDAFYLTGGTALSAFFSDTEKAMTLTSSQTPGRSSCHSLISLRHILYELGDILSFAFPVADLREIKGGRWYYKDENTSYGYTS